MLIVYVVCIPGDDCWESVYVASSYEGARAFIEKERYKSWSIQDHAIDKEED